MWLLSGGFISLLTGMITVALVELNFPNAESNFSVF
jgi:hypothetical protein